ncbi:uncharacterized protein LOC135806703 [Sycon ciliatum]|uniref:uncharacterized protein LOC135806703 n=1 Tax=Sycon ciliatum TaxID=27933 RepID=UPI0031F6F1B0
MIPADDARIFLQRISRISPRLAQALLAKSVCTAGFHSTTFSGLKDWSPAIHTTLHAKLKLYQAKCSIVEMVMCNAVVWAVDRRQPIVLALSPQHHNMLGIVDCRNDAPLLYHTKLLTQPDSSGKIGPPQHVPTKKRSATRTTGVQLSLPEGHRARATTMVGRDDAPVRPHLTRPHSTSKVETSVTTFSGSDSSPRAGRKSAPEVDMSLDSFTFAGRSTSSPLLQGKMDVMKEINSDDEECNKVNSNGGGALRDKQRSRTMYDGEATGSPAQREFCLEGSLYYLAQSCTSILAFDNALWVARSCADILIISSDLRQGCPFLGQLSCSLHRDVNVSALGSQHRLALCSDQYAMSQLQLLRSDKTRPPGTIVWWCGRHVSRKHCTSTTDTVVIWTAARSVP